MSDISKINPNNGLNVYDLKDSICRNALTISDPTDGDGIITFGVDADGNYGYKKVGADTVIPFKSGGQDVSEFTTSYRDRILLSSSVNTTTKTMYNMYVEGNIDIPLLNNISLTKGLWLSVLAKTLVTANLIIKDTNGNYISALSQVRAHIYGDSTQAPQIYLFNIDEDITIEAIQFTTGIKIYTSEPNQMFFISFIKMS